MRLTRRLNEDGVEDFAAWLAAGAPGSAPRELLVSPATSEAVPGLNSGQPKVEDRYELGVWLNEQLEGLDQVELAIDRRMWTSLALFMFDDICPPFASGRKLAKMYSYILSTDYRHYYRHLVRTPWQLVRDHGINSRLLLLSSSERPFPLRTHGEVLEQLAGRAGVLRSKSLIAEANRLYGDPKTGRPRPRVASKNVGGTVRRLGAVLRQFDLTYDVEDLRSGVLMSILPQEFDRWRAAQSAIAA
jgi:hypothetical protein